MHAKIAEKEKMITENVREKGNNRFGLKVGGVKSRSTHACDTLCKMEKIA